MRTLLLTLVISAIALPALADDRDGDGIEDAADLCPDVREGAGVIFPRDGCPDVDGDGDRIVDDYDVCPDAAETINGYDDADGCPDTRTTDSPVVALPVDLAIFSGRWPTTLSVDVSIATDGHQRLRGLSVGPAAPPWLGAASTQYECYAARRIDERAALHCRTNPSTGREITVAFRRDGDRLVGIASGRTHLRIDYASFTGLMGASFDHAAVTRTLQAAGDAIQECYEAQLRTQPTLAGRVTIQITVETSGEVDQVHATADTLAPPSPEVGDCIMAILDAATFHPAPVGSSVSFTFPFVFEPETDDSAH